MSDKFIVVRADWTHFFKEGEVVSLAPQEHELWKVVRKWEDEGNSSDGVYLNKEGTPQLLENSMVKPYLTVVK